MTCREAFFPYCCCCGGLLFGCYGQRRGPDDEGRPPSYEEVDQAHERLPPLLKERLDEYCDGDAARPPLVLFWDAIEHLSRLCRLLHMPGGAAMLVGVSGCGKRTLTRFAAFLAGQACVGLDPHCSHSLADYREDLKAFCVRAGGEGERLALLLTDAQLENEDVLEDVSALLNVGEVPGLFPPDELEALVTQLRPLCAAPVCPCASRDAHTGSTRPR